MIAVVCNVKIARTIYFHIAGIMKLRVSGGPSIAVITSYTGAGYGSDHTVGCDLSDPVIGIVGDINITRTIYFYTGMKVVFG